MKKLLLAGLLLASCTAPGSGYVQADLATFEAIAPSYSAYVLADPLLNQPEKDRRLLVVETWRARLYTAPGVLK